MSPLDRRVYDVIPPDADMSGMDPHARRFLMMIALGAADTAHVGVDERRGSFEKLMRLSKPPATDIDVRDQSIMVGGRDIPVRTYAPTPGRSIMPGLIYFHGGGLVAGSTETHDALCRWLSYEAQCRVVSVAYRLAPEHPFPAAIVDALVAVRHLLRHAERFGLAAERIAVGGDSGGGTLAAIVCQAFRHRLKAQILLCPVLDFAGSHPSRRAFASGFLLDEAMMARDLVHYAPYRPLDDPRISPLRATSLSGLPPTIIHTAGFDPMRDEGAAYATRLAAAGVDVSYTCHATLIHHFYGLTGMIPEAGKALSAIARDINRVLS